MNLADHSGRHLAESTQDACVPARRPAGPGQVKSSADGVRCVIVDDDDRFIRVVSGLLVGDGFHVVGAACDRAQGLRLVADVSPDVALVDLCLGRDSGTELIADIARTALAARVFMILVSACAEDELREVFELSAADGYLPKPNLSGGAIRQLLRGRITARSTPR
jgi:two-component system, response regulator PdtaR